MKHFEEIQVIGDGGFGTVTKCRDRSSGEIVAVKRLKQKYASFEQCLQENEVKSLRKIKHQNVERLLQVFRENEHLYLVFELLGETLFKTIQKRTHPFSDEEVRNIIAQTLSGLAVCHKQGFFHRDMKPDNLLWGKDDILKIADFGLAKEIRSRPPFTEYVGTRWYRAPEIILRHQFYNSPVDIWAVGAIMAELYTLRPIFPGTSEADQMYKIISVLGPPNNQNWPDGLKLAEKRNMRFPATAGSGLQSLLPNACPDAIDLISKMFSYDPAKRPSASQALGHRFFRDPSVTPLIDARLVAGSPLMSPKKAQSSLETKYHIQESTSQIPTEQPDTRQQGSKSHMLFVKDPPPLPDDLTLSNDLFDLEPKDASPLPTEPPKVVFGNSNGGNFKAYSLKDDADLFDDMF